MTTLTTVEQLRELPEDTVIRERGGSVLQKDGDGWETTYGSFVDHEGVQLPAQTLHPRTISAGDAERALAVLTDHLPEWQSDDSSAGFGEGPYAGWGCTLCSEDSVIPGMTSEGEKRAVNRHALATALTALGFEVTE